MSMTHRTPSGTGVGLRLPHMAGVVATRPNAAWLEIHPENFLANPHATELLVQLAEDYPISVHTVGVSIGSVGGVDSDHLRRVRTLVDLVDPFLVSGHLAWSTHEGDYLNDLLPLPFDNETLDVLARHLHQVQEGLGRPYLLENPSSYVGFGTSTMTEVQFLAELSAGPDAGCCATSATCTSARTTWVTTRRPISTRSRPTRWARCILGDSLQRTMGPSLAPTYGWTHTQRRSPTGHWSYTLTPSADSGHARP